MSFLLDWLLTAPGLPRRFTAEAWRNLWFDGVFRGATLASLVWLALIVAALWWDRRRPP